jgi:hypothetical protein
MRLAGLLVVLACLFASLPFGAQAQPLPELDPKKDKAADKKESATPNPPLPPKPRPRVSLKPKGGTGSNVGDDAPGGGATTAEPSKGGTPGTPSGSFTGPASKP